MAWVHDQGLTGSFLAMISVMSLGGETIIGQGGHRRQGVTAAGKIFGMEEIGVRIASMVAGAVDQDRRLVEPQDTEAQARAQERSMRRQHCQFQEENQETFRMFNSS